MTEIVQLFSACHWGKQPLPQKGECLEKSFLPPGEQANESLAAPGSWRWITVILASALRFWYLCTSCTLHLLNALIKMLTLYLLQYFLRWTSCITYIRVICTFKDPGFKVLTSWNRISRDSPLYAESNKKWYKWTDGQNRNRLTDLENELMGAGEKDY